MSTNIKETKFTVKNPDGLEIVGWVLELDDGKAHKKGAIVSHGFRATAERERPYAQHLASLGFKTWLFDFNGGGPGTRSQGSFSTYMTPMTEVKDLNTIIDLALKTGDIDSLILEGHSQGGFVSSYVAAHRNDDISGLLLYYPAMSIPHDARAGAMQCFKFDPNNIPDQIEGGGLTISGNYPKSVMNLDIFKIITGYKKPVFLVHGDSDPVVNWSFAQKTALTFVENGNDLTFHTIKGGSHGFTGQLMSDAMKAADGFLIGNQLMPQ